MEHLDAESQKKWDKRYMELAELVATWSTCFRAWLWDWKYLSALKSGWLPYDGA